MFFLTYPDKLARCYPYIPRETPGSSDAVPAGDGATSAPGNRGTALFLSASVYTRLRDLARKKVTPRPYNEERMDTDVQTDIDTNEPEPVTDVLITILEEIESRLDLPSDDE